MKTNLVLAGVLLSGIVLQAQANVAAPNERLQKNGGSACAPAGHDGAQWLKRCESAATAGDAWAAIIVGKIYWNGDGVSRDNVAAFRWWILADKAGRPEAAKLLGDEAYVRMARAKGPLAVDRAILNDAIGWYQKASKVEPDLASRQQAQERLDQLLRFRSMLPPK